MFRAALLCIVAVDRLVS